MRVPMVALSLDRLGDMLMQAAAGMSPVVLAAEIEARGAGADPFCRRFDVDVEPALYAALSCRVAEPVEE